MCINIHEIAEGMEHHCQYEHQEDVGSDCTDVVSIDTNPESEESPDGHEQGVSKSLDSLQDNH